MVGAGSMGGAGGAGKARRSGCCRCAARLHTAGCTAVSVPPTPASCGPAQHAHARQGLACLQREAAKSTASARLSCVHTMPAGSPAGSAPAVNQSQGREALRGRWVRRCAHAAAARNPTPSGAHPAAQLHVPGPARAGAARRTDVAGPLVGQVDVLLRHDAARDAGAQHVFQEAVQLHMAGGWGCSCN